MPLSGSIRTGRLGDKSGPTAMSAPMSALPESGRRVDIGNPGDLTGVTEYLAEVVRSLRLDVGCSDHLTPLLDLVGNEFSKVGGRTGKHHATEVGKAGLYLGVG